MSVKAMTWVFEHSPYLLGKRLIHLVIADVANDGHENLVWISQADIAARARVTRQTVNLTIRQMVDEGYLELVEQRPGRPCLYRMHHGVSENPTGGGVKPVDTQVSSQLTGGVGLTQFAPLIELKELKENASDFPLFWSLYPKRNGKKLGKGECERHWQRMSQSYRQGALVGVKHYAHAVAEDLTMAKDPIRFLKHRVWEDWQEPATPDRPQGGKSAPSVPAAESRHPALVAQRRREEQNGRLL